jgi:hypothetical protein
MKIAIILVNYNGKQYNTACINSLLACTDHHDKKIYVVDNASTDDSVQLLRERCKADGRIELITLDDNYGFSYANNVGIAKALEQGAEYVLLLNNDTEVEPDMIEQLLACAARHPDSMIAPKIYYSDDRTVIWSAGGEVSPIVRKVSHTGLNRTDKGQFDTEKEIGFATGCALLIPKTVIRRAGMLDERFFLYYEDTEYSFRLQKKGISIYYCPTAVLYHKVGASSKGADSPLCAYYIARNWLLCSHTQPGGRFPVFAAYYVVNRLICCLLWLLRGRTDLVCATWRGIRDYHRGRFGRSADYL